MKKTNKFDHTAEIIMDELAVVNGSISFDAAFRRGYEQVMELPATKKKRKSGRIIGFASSCAAMLVVGMLVLNMANPALAESLPLIGGIFKAVNTSSQEGTVNHNNLVIDDLQNVAMEPQLTDNSSITVKGNGAFDAAMTFQVEEYYFDGYFLHLGSELVFEQAPSGRTDVYAEGQISFDGETWHSFGGGEDPSISELDPSSFKSDSGRFLHTFSFPVPEEYRGKESFKVSQRISRVLCYTESGEFIETENSQAEEISLTVARGTSKDAEEINTPAQVDGITLKSAVKSFSGVSVSFEGLPYSDDVHPMVMAYQMNGTILTGAFINSDNQAGTQSLLVTTQEDTVIFTIRNKQSENLEVLAEFTVNFKNMTITPSEYHLAVDGPSYYDINSFTYGYFHDGTQGTDFYLNRAFASGEKAGYIAVGTNVDYRALRIEAYRDGELVANVRTVSEGTGVREGEAAFQSTGSDAGTFGSGKGEYGFTTVLDGTEYTLSADSMLTVKVYDGATDELLHEETQALNDKHFF